MDIADGSSSTLSAEKKETNNHYRYLKLKPGNIRLLTLLPGTSDAPGTCTVTHESFRPSQHLAEKALVRPKYCALSYVWGSPSPQRWIEVEGQTLYIRDNLWQFLRRLRQQTSSRTLWVDAVAMMGSIFRFADDVLAWVGEEADDSAFLMHLAASSKKREGDIGLAQLHCAAERLRTWQALKAFFGRPYWTRTWIMQEVVLAKNPVLIFCGADVAAYDGLYRMVLILDMGLRGIPYLIIKRTSSRKKRELESVLASGYEHGGDKLPIPRTFGGSPGPLTITIRKYAYTECSDARDKMTLICRKHHPGLTIRKTSTRFSSKLARYATGFELLPEPGADFGKQLMRSMRLTPESLRNYIAFNDTYRSNAKASLQDSLTLRPAFWFNGQSLPRPGYINPSADYLKVTRVKKGHVLAFEVDIWRFGDGLIRGIAYDVQCGDQIHIANLSDVALVTRVRDNHSFAIGWALVERGQDWGPGAAVERLTYLWRQPFQISPDLSGTAPFDTSGCLLLEVSLPVAVTVIEGAILNKAVIRRSIDRTDSKRSRRSPWKCARDFYRDKRHGWSMSLFWHLSVEQNINESYNESRGSPLLSPTFTLGAIGRSVIEKMAKHSLVCEGVVLGARKRYTT
ncbi:heterokaryon incompatibility protein-domain-containing protein [Exophiala viscosa]|uniref:heterokaryon incompatibility protein-domain-containing protein n=1 Tax=Exophiala viscosa TaxID=2486360 RepID=UPI00218CFB84|nr:heterokaryon incompatibility protein-domain-containing protein [Exophiala viscosa]